MSTFVHVDNKAKGILFLIKGITHRLDNTTVTAEGKYLTNFSRSNIKFCLSLHYNGRKSFLIVNGTKLYQFKGKDSEIKKTINHV